MEDKEFEIEIKIKELRREHHLSQEELAEALGISRQSVNSLEQGRSLPSLPLAVSFCKFFNTAFEEIFEFEREVERAIENQQISFDNVEKISDQNSALEFRKEKNMVELEPWRPAREAVSLRDAMDRLFEDSFITPGKIAPMPKLDIIDQKDSIQVRAELPGISEDDVNIEIKDIQMTISGETKQEKSFDSTQDKEAKGAGYYYKESHSGSFSRTITLPADVQGDKAEAEMKDGILSITVPKVEEKKAKKIAIKKK
jgi:HSP20 family protein